MRLSGIRQDVTVGLRGLLRSPGFAAAALVTLALGIGATSAIFTVVRAVLLAPLPYAEPDRRVMIWSRWISFDKTWLSDQEILDYRRLSRTMTAVAGWTSAQQNLTGDGEPVRVSVGQVTANTFEVLGAAPLLGRVIADGGRSAQRRAGRRAGLRPVADALRRRPGHRRPADPPQRRAGRSGRGHAAGLPAADRLHRGSRRAHRAVAARCRSTRPTPSAAPTATSARRCWPRDRRPPPPPPSCSRSPPR